jgi:hypothetical protein
MELAPQGSCSNDPTLAKCEKVSAIIYNPEMFDLSAGAPAPAPAATARVTTASRKANRLRAKATSYSYACALKVNSGSPYWDGEGYVRMDAQNSRWFYPSTAEGHWHGSLRYACTAYPTRLWRGEAHAFVTFRGIRWAGYAERYGSVNCG